MRNAREGTYRKSRRLELLSVRVITLGSSKSIRPVKEGDSLSKGLERKIAWREKMSETDRAVDWNNSGSFVIGCVHASDMANRKALTRPQIR